MDLSELIEDLKKVDLEYCGFEWGDEPFVENYRNLLEKNDISLEEILDVIKKFYTDLELGSCHEFAPREFADHPIFVAKARGVMQEIVQNFIDEKFKNVEYDIVKMLASYGYCVSRIYELPDIKSDDPGWKTAQIKRAEINWGDLPHCINILMNIDPI